MDVARKKTLWILQIDPQHWKCPSVNSLPFRRDENIEVSLTQMSWVGGVAIKGSQVKHSNWFYDQKDIDRHETRTSVTARRSLVQVFLKRPIEGLFWFGFIRVHNNLMKANPYLIQFAIYPHKKNFLLRATLALAEK